MSEETTTTNYLVYEREIDAIARADLEGHRRGYAYHNGGSGTRYHTFPIATSDGRYALLVNEYELTEDEKSQISTTIALPEPRE